MKTICNGQFSDCNSVLPIGEEEKGYKFPVYIAVDDRFGGRTTNYLNVTVRKCFFIYKDLITVQGQI